MKADLQREHGWLQKLVGEWTMEMEGESRALTLDTEGPSFTKEGEMARYKDRIELTSYGSRVLTSSVLGEDGEWHKFVRAEYRRA